MIDMHTHSTNSDGIYSPIELLKKAEEEKLDYYSITDHDRVSAYEDLIKTNTKKYFSGKIVLGSEIRFVYKGCQMEVLAYGYDYDKLKNNYWLTKDSYHAIKKALLKNLLEKAKLVGFVYNNIEYSETVKPEKLFFEELKKHEENNHIFNKYDIVHGGHFFRKLIANPNSPMYFDPTNYSLSFEDATNLIHSAGGLAILAHPFGVYNIENPKEIINELIASKKLDGLECMHSDIKPEQTQYLLDLCNKNNLLSTGGSDYHGFANQYFARANGGQDKIPTSLIKNFLNKINPKGIIG